MKRLLLILTTALALPAAAVPVRGMVRQLDGLPAVGVAVRCEPEDKPFTFDSGDAVGARTDAAGAFALDLRPGTWQVEAYGVANATRQTLRVEAGQPVELRLGVDWPWSTPPTALLPVRLVGRDGQPAARGPVTATLAGLVEQRSGGWRPELAEGGWTQAWPGWFTSDYGLSAATDGAGRAVFRLPAGLLTVGLRGRGARQVDAFLARPGQTLPERTLVVDPEPKAEPNTNRSAPFDNWVRILGPDGGPLANQWVRLRRLEYDDRFVVHTDAQGAARVRGFYDEAQFVAKAPGLAESAPQWLVHRREQGAATFRLTERATTLAGTLRDPAGAPLAGCRVFACRPAVRGRYDNVAQRDRCLAGIRCGFYEPGSGCEPREPAPPAFAGWLPRCTYYAETAADGSYRFADLDPGRWHVVFVKPGYVTDELRAVPPDGRLDQVLQPDANALRAQVLDTDGRPWANRAVRVDVRPASDALDLRLDEMASATVLTDDAGRFALGPEELPACTSDVTVSTGVRTATVDAVALNTHGPTEVTLTLSPEHVVTGRVLLPDGRPAAQAWVGHVRSSDSPTTWTDADGRFRLACWGEGQADLVVCAEGCATTRFAADTTAAKPLEVRLAPGTTLRGQITLRRPAQVEALPIMCRVEGEDWPNWHDWREGRALYGFDTFVLAGLPLGQVHLTAAPSDDAFGEATVTLPTDQPVQLRVEILGRGTVSGGAFGLDGRPRAGVTVVLTPQRGAPVSQVTRADGRFRFERVLAGSYDLDFSEGELRLDSRRGKVTAGAEDTVGVRLPRTVAGKLAGLPAGWSGVVALVDPREWRDWERSTAGWPDALRLPILPLRGAAQPVENGAYRAAVQGAGGRVRVVVLGSSEDGDRDRSVELLWNLDERAVPTSGKPFDLSLPARGAVLAADVTGIKPAGRGEAALILLSDLTTRQLVGAGHLGADGSLEWPCLPAGRCRVVASLYGLACPVQEVDLADGQTRRVAVRPCAGVAVSGTVAGVGEDAEVVLSNDAVYGVARAGKDGAWRIDGVPPGTYQLWTPSPEGAAHRKVEVGTAPVTVVVPAPGDDAKKSGR